MPWVYSVLLVVPCCISSQFQHLHPLISNYGTNSNPNFMHNRNLTTMTGENY
ncbi:hypothetical protein Hanom_Chr05g00394001 [Helianthus anomalus]